MYNFSPTSRPTPQNYDAWYQWRIDRTNDVMSKQKSITGLEVREQNLSMKVLYDAGWKYNLQTDSMVK